MANFSTGNAGSSGLDLANRGLVYYAWATVTAPVIYTTAAGTGGPLLWNGSGGGNTNQVTAYILGLTVANTTASTAPGQLGFTGNKGQSAAPTGTSAVTTVANARIGASGPLCNVYAVGTPSSAGNFFIPVYNVTTTAVGGGPTDAMPKALEGAIVVPPGSWVSLAGSATLTTGVFTVGIAWVEVPAL